MSRLTPPVGPADHVIGNPRAPVTLVEYGDYQCPFTGRAHHVLEALLRQFGSDMRCVYRHFPLTDLHPHALPAALAAEGAAAQGKFWAMHRTLFENQGALEEADLIAYADAIGLDVPRFSHDLELAAHHDRINHDFASGERSGVTGTPTFFVNGFRFEEQWDKEALGRAIDRARTETRQAHR